MTGFDTFENRWEITSTLTLDTPLHIGGGLNAAAYSLSAGAVIQQTEADGMAQPYLPGSSLKGVIRGTLERLIHTFHSSNCNISDGRRAGRPCGHSDCRPCQIFGSLSGGSQITVRDAGLTSESAKIHRTAIQVADQPHCATKYSRDLVPEQKYGKIDSRLWLHERVAAGLQFSLSILLDNADETDVGLILLALDEFNQKRATLGGGTSRGLGFVSVTIPESITKKRIANQSPFAFYTEQVSSEKTLISAKKYLASNGAHAGMNNENDFSYYAHAFDPAAGQGKTPAGCVVFSLDVETITPFRMPGSEEQTVTCNGEPYIPGSTIKGFLRHRFIGLKNHGTDPEITTEWVYHVFGAANDYGTYTNRQRPHRSHILISDAFSETKAGKHDEIPANTLLEMWILFDNMESPDIEKIMNELTASNGVRITGSTIAKGAESASEAKTIKEPKFNVIKVSKRSILPFRAATYLKQ